MSNSRLDQIAQADNSPFEAPDRVAMDQLASQEETSQRPTEAIVKCVIATSSARAETADHHGEHYFLIHSSRHQP